ncbi:hypothetical protein [Longispora fulva]|uniref:Uncharacterized protein n=1 Tax=Longispora fulva TaxID=619741 RepID=A0A8J7KE12_9ACTN|nr:hypothetical protein [Longispora fulva]MBG6134655.1 hypothetical protein [Longispora fulva]
MSDVFPHYEDLVELLMKGAGGIYLQEAATRLLARHGYWLRDREFLRFVVTYEDPPVAAGIRWKAAVDALDRGELEAGIEERSILRIAASLCTFYNISLRDVVEGIDAVNIKHVAESIMYADGYLNSIAEPIA